MAHKKNVYDFPILSVRELVANVADLGGSVDEKQLLNPTVEVIWPLYEMVAQTILGISQEAFLQPDFDKLCKLEYAEMHQDSVGCYSSFRTIQKLMLDAGIGDFGLRDLLIKPDSYRCIRHLSGLINYARFREDRENKLAEHQDESRHETRQQLLDEIKEVKDQISAVQVQRESEIPAAQEREAENDELWQQIVTLHKQQEIYPHEIRALTAELNSIKDSIAGQNYMLQAAKLEASDLRGQIVDSPEKLERALVEARAALESIQSAAEESRRNLQRSERKLDIHKKSKKKMEKLVELSEELQKQLSLLKQASKEVKALKTWLKADELEDRQRNSKLNDLKSKGQNLQNAIEGVEHSNLEKKTQEERRLQETRDRYESFQAKKQDMRSSINKKKAQIQFLLSQEADVIKSKDEAIRTTKEGMAAVEQKALDYLQKLLSCAGPIPKLSD